MTLTVGIMSAGEMGSAVGAVLRHQGARVVTQSRNRSERTRARAARAGIEEVADDTALLREADVLLSILVPAEAMALAERVAQALRTGPGETVYVDCNAIAPQTTSQIGEVIERAGGRFVDAGIIGPPPQPGATSTRFYASGGNAPAFAELADFGLDVRVVSNNLGDASAIKMCYAAMTKGTTALMTQLSIAAERLGVSGALREEFEESQPAALERMQRTVPNMVPKAHRWVGEMEEIAKTFGACGLTPLTFEGAAAIYDFVAGHATPERSRFDDIMTTLAQAD